MEGTPDDIAIREHRLQSLDGGDLGPGSVNGHGHDAVRDDEIHVRGRRNLSQSVEVQADAWNADDIELSSRRIGRAFQRIGDRVQRFRVRIVRPRR